MELGMYKGKVRWLKKDGAPSKVGVSLIKELEYLGFPVPSGPGGGECLSLVPLLGNPYENDRLVVKADGNNWYGHFLVKQNDDPIEMDYETPELIRQNKLTLGNAEQFPYKSGQQKRYERSSEIDPEELSEEKGLQVYEDCIEHNGEHVYWIKDREGFTCDIPAGWSFVPSGDAKLTQRLARRYPHWKVSQRNNFGYYDRVGILVSLEAYNDVFDELGGVEGQAERKSAKLEVMQKKEAKINAKLEESLRRQFPSMPDRDIHDIMLTCRRSKCVGNAPFLYFATTEQQEDAFDNAARLAAIAHARHQYTRYDELFAEEYSRDAARQETWGDVSDMLSKWS